MKKIALFISLVASLPAGLIANGVQNCDVNKEQACVYQFNQETNLWTTHGSVIAIDKSIGRHGNSISINSDGMILAVGAISANEVYVYQYTGDDTSWRLLGSAIPGEAAYDENGRSVSLSADGMRVAIGSPRNDDNGNSSGQVRVYEYDGGSSSWVQVGNNMPQNHLASGDQSGYSVSLSADGMIVAIGSPGNNDNGKNSGKVRVYEWSGTNWNQLGTNIDGEAALDKSGYSVSLSADGKRLAIGAPKNSDNGINSGQVRVYEWNGVNWGQIGVFTGENSRAYFGMSVSLSGNGSELAISSNGSAKSFVFDNTSWKQQGNTINGASGEQISISEDGTTLAVLPS